MKNQEMLGGFSKIGDVNMKKYKVGIIGCGTIFPMHAVPVYELEETDLVAVCDIKEDRAKDCAERFDCRYYIDYKEMIENEDLDVVHICTPHYLHAPMAIYAAQKKVNILTEKPMAINVKEAKAMIKAANDNDVSLGVIFQNRYNKGAIAIKKALDEGLLGQIYSCKMQVTWDRSDEYYSKSDWKGTWDKEGGGVVIDQSIHTLDLMRWFVGSDVQFVDAHIANRLHEEIEVEDSAEGVIGFKNGVNGAFFTINYYTDNSPVVIEMHCENGFIKYEGETAHIKYNDGRETIVSHNPNESFHYGNVKSYWGVSHVKQIKDHYKHLSEGKNPPITGEEAILTQQVVNAIYESGKMKKRIYI